MERQVEWLKEKLREKGSVTTWKEGETIEVCLDGRWIAIFSPESTLCSLPLPEEWIKELFAIGMGWILVPEKEERLEG